MCDNMPSAIQHVRSGKLRPIAVTTAKRSPELPDVPTVAESGVPGYEATSWFGLWTQAKTPAPIQQRLYTAIAKVLKDPAVVKKINDQGGDVVIDTPAEFLTYIKAESAKWSKVVKDSGAQV
jgi:tripartite-type tricarboxylate transporter receptor subunit TctC